MHRLLHCFILLIALHSYMISTYYTLRSIDIRIYDLFLSGIGVLVWIDDFTAVYCTKYYLCMRKVGTCIMVGVEGFLFQ